MNNCPSKFIFTSGFFLGIVFGITIYIMSYGSLLSQAQKAVVECENTLPRNESCVVTASRENNNG